MFMKYAFIILIGYLAWIISNAYFYPIINDFVFDKNYPVYLYNTYSLCLYCIIGLWVGWTGKSKGWLLGLILGVLIFLSFVFVSLENNDLGFEVNHVGYVDLLIKIVTYHAVFTAVLILAAFLGWKIRKKATKAT